ncbi:hypothetical protein H2198_000601 [Neophaeococcomyces mojaviensis]|uniref:Uncharacterized protein n=1 Tax=Neophaeococcomyces mojaviensis TaxID=3383035 RepID=A0ACC3AJA6_9EURO|nr:hypothetical protein H2198_000601 [Knufia sp. JES_112]
MVSARNIGKVENISSPDAAHDDTTKWYKALNFGFFDAKCAAILPPPGTVSYIQPLQEYIIPGHYYLARAMGIVRLIDTDGDETRRINSHRNDVAESHLKLGSARLRPALCDPRMFSRWVKACEKLHHKKCDKFKRQIKHPLRLLNTSNLRLETFDPNSVPRYFTLSYVWGTKKYVRLEEAVLSEVTNTGFRDNVNFHPAVSDAIALMKGMNETYLWVDSLCIIQDSATDKLAQIYQMDSIYANSTLTIVAAGDEQEGLPGICKPRTEISSLQVGNLMFVADACASSESHWSDNTIWSSRAWTLQEYIVSPHRLIFTADQVYWWCQATSWRESTYLASHTHRYKAMLLEPDMPLTEMHTLPVAAFATNSEPKYLSKFGEIVEQYSRRKVTVEMDRLFAFQGVLNTIKAVDPRKDHFWALTTWDFEIELDWSDADPYSSAGEFRPFASHLFPSWSWLSYPSPVTLGTEYARITCFRFFHGATTASLECQRISPMQYKPQPTTTNTPYYLLDISMPAIQAQFPKTTFNADRQIIFWADIARLGVTWNKTLDFFTGRLVTGYDETMFPTLEDQYHCLLCWSAEIDKTETEYDFVSINNRFRGDQRCRLIWMLRWKDDGTAVRAGHGIIMGTVWDSLVKRQRIIVMD